MTIDKRRPSTRPVLPDFTPVPRHYQRHDGWTGERQRTFIAALADTGSVKAAAHRVNMTPEGAYQLRRHPEAASFRKAWEAALALGVQQLEDLAMERALHGQEVPVYSYGKLIGSRVVHNDRLVMFLLRNRAPARFAADGHAGARRGGLNDPHDAARLSRLKRQWRKEWEAERAAEQAKKDEAAARDSEAIVQSINAKIERMAQRRLDAMTPRTRALHDAYYAALEEDRVHGRTAWNAGEDGGENRDGEAETAADDWEDDDQPAPTHRLEWRDYPKDEEE